MSNPPNIGDPSKTAITTTMPKTTPTATNRLFIENGKFLKNKNEVKLNWKNPLM